MYDPSSEAHEFIGRDRAEALAKAAAFFGAGEEELAVTELDSSRVSGLGARIVLVAYPRAAGAPGRHSGGDRGGDRDRGPDPRRAREREGPRERGERGERGGRDRERGRPRGRDDREGGERGRGRSPAPAAAALPAAGPSKGTATAELGEIGRFVCGLVERMEVGSFEISESGEGEGLIAIQLAGPGALELASGDGRAVDAIQLLANQASLRIGGDDARRVVLDVEGNADQRADFLSRIAERAAERARETGRPVALEAMSPKDRRTVHVALREVEGIATMSVGEGRYRQVVVVPDNAPEYEEARRYESQPREGRD